MIRNWSVTCPTCLARPNHPCRHPRAGTLPDELSNGLKFTGEPRRLHAARLKAARKAAPVHTEALEDLERLKVALDSIATKED